MLDQTIDSRLDDHIADLSIRSSRPTRNTSQSVPAFAEANERRRTMISRGISMAENDTKTSGEPPLKCTTRSQKLTSNERGAVDCASLPFQL